MARPRFSVAQILGLADAFQARTCHWPHKDSGPIPSLPGENWRRVDNALRFGLRGLEGGSSQAQLLDEQRGVRKVRDLPPLTEETILGWTDHHRAVTGSYPNKNSGPVLAAPGETCWNIDASLREGFRGLLAMLLAEHWRWPKKLWWRNIAAARDIT
jgi:hypothetical protein